MGKLIAALKRLPKRTSAAVAIVAAAVIVPATLFAWGPGRDTYTIEQPADHVVFNSITNNPEYGDERSFLTVRDLTTGQQLSGSTTVVPDHEYLFQVYVHNNAASNLNSAANGYKGIAHGTTLEAAIPSEVNGTAEAAAYVRASNANPAEVWDTVALKSTGKVGFDYQEGTARLFTNHYKNGQALSDNVMTDSGVKIGYDNLNGDWPGCLNYSGTVTFRVKAYSKTPDFTIQKQVRKANDSTSKFGDSVQATPGTKLNYRLTFTNTGKTDLKNVVLKDKLPQGITYVPGSVMILNASHPGGAYIQDGDKLFTTGVGIGNYTAGSNALVIFDATVAKNDDLPKCGDNLLKNIASAQPEGQNPKEDSADVTVPKECQPEEKPCSYECKALTVTKVDRTHFKFAVTTAQENATFKKVTYVIRDAQGKEIERKESTAKTLDYTQTTVGKYTVEALVTFDVKGQEKTVTSTGCKKPFEVEKVPETPAYTCDALTAKKISRAEYHFTGKATATGGATITGYTIDFGDGQSATVADATNVPHTYAEAKEYTAKLTVTVKVNNEEKTVTDNQKCVVKVTVSPEECKPGIPVGDERCEEKPECKPGIPVGDERCEEKPECKPGVPMGDERCVEKPEECKPGVPMGDKACEEIPAELPQTGNDGLMAVIGAGALIAAVGYYVASRRSLIG